MYRVSSIHHHMDIWKVSESPEYTNIRMFVRGVRVSSIHHHTDVWKVSESLEYTNIRMFLRDSESPEYTNIRKYVMELPWPGRFYVEGKFGFRQKIKLHF